MDQREGATVGEGDRPRLAITDEGEGTKGGTGGIWVRHARPNVLKADADRREVCVGGDGDRYAHDVGTGWGCVVGETSRRGPGVGG